MGPGSACGRGCPPPPPGAAPWPGPTSWPGGSRVRPGGSCPRPGPPPRGAPAPVTASPLGAGALGLAVGHPMDTVKVTGPGACEPGGGCGPCPAPTPLVAGAAAGAGRVPRRPGLRAPHVPRGDGALARGPRARFARAPPPPTRLAGAPTLHAAPTCDTRSAAPVSVCLTGGRVQGAVSVQGGARALGQLGCSQEAHARAPAGHLCFHEGVCAPAPS